MQSCYIYVLFYIYFYILRIVQSKHHHHHAAPLLKTCAISASTETQTFRWVEKEAFENEMKFSNTNNWTDVGFFVLRV